MVLQAREWRAARESGRTRVIIIFYSKTPGICHASDAFEHGGAESWGRVERQKREPGLRTGGDILHKNPDTHTNKVSANLQDSGLHLLSY